MVVRATDVREYPTFSLRVFPTINNHPFLALCQNVSGDVFYSDLSTHEKELLLRASRKKSKEERQNERRFKRERDREKREYERKKRRERHGKHRRDGLVKEYLIPVSLLQSA